MKTPHILYCHCAHAAVLPEATRAAVLEGMARRGAGVRFVADLCELSAGHDPSLKDFSAGATIIACHPRAVRWLFAYAGAPLADDTRFLNMRAHDAAFILSQLAPGEHTGGSVPPAKKPTFAAKALGDWVPWFPVIDYDRCKDCRQCQQFCLFGVYAADPGGRVSVVKPEKCKTNCPACARICPQAAIVFPKFTEAGPISGDDTPPPERAEPPIDFSSLAGLDFQEALRHRRRF